MMSSWRSVADTEPCSSCKLRVLGMVPRNRRNTSMKPSEAMPGALPAMWRALKRGYEAEPLMLPVAFGLSLLAALPDALMALGLKLVADGLTRGDRRLVIGVALGLGTAAAATW